MPVLYVRVPDEVMQFVKDCQGDSGLSMAMVVAVLLEEARERGWTVRAAAAKIVEPG